MTNKGYPIIEQKPLAPIKKRLIGRTRRDLNQLPKQHPGSIYVLRENNQYHAKAAGQIEDDDELWVFADSVTTVDTSARQVVLECPIPSDSPADRFVLECRFRCQVTSAEAVAAAGNLDIDAEILAFLMTDEKLWAIGSDLPIEHFNAVQARALARITAYRKHRRPPVSGLSVNFIGVQVPVPEHLRDSATRERDRLRAHVEQKRESARKHSQAKKEEDRRQKLELRRENFELAIARRVQAVIEESPEAFAAFGLRKGDVSINAVLERLHNDRANRQLLDEKKRDRKEGRKRQKTDVLIKLVQIFADRHMYDRAVDPTAVLEKLVGDIAIGHTRKPVGKGAKKKKIEAAPVDHAAESMDEENRPSAPDQSVKRRRPRPLSSEKD